uniref:Methylated-DNA--protein-cysteine methyltransferase n=1 Tax=Zonotrichia albicollis TaxID=44394 RepID=A0A8D2MZE5_ZONAL
MGFDKDFEKQVVLLSPLGRMEISGCDKGVHEIKLPKPSLPTPGPEPQTSSSAYTKEFSFTHSALSLCLADSFTRQVLWTLLNDVKFGEAVSYKQLADLAGNGRAARAVGGAMRSNPIPIIIPCHRVIRSSGDSGNYGGGQPMKEWLLCHERLQKEKLAQGGGCSPAPAHNHGSSA